MRAYSWGVTLYGSLQGPGNSVAGGLGACNEEDGELLNQPRLGQGLPFGVSQPQQVPCTVQLHIFLIPATQRPVVCTSPSCSARQLECSLPYLTFSRLLAPLDIPCGQSLLCRVLVSNSVHEIEVSPGKHT